MANRLAFGSLAALLVLAAPPLSAADSEELAGSLVVMIEGTLGGARTSGAGLVFAVEEDIVYIVTARHVILGGVRKAEKLQVRFAHRSAPLPARWERVHPDVDLGVVSVTGSGLRERDVPCGLVGDPTRLRRGDPVHYISRFRERTWWSPPRPDSVSEVRSMEIEFHSEMIAVGASGGGLFDADFKLVGMLVNTDDRALNRALRIDRVLELLRTEPLSMRPCLGSFHASLCTRELRMEDPPHDVWERYKLGWEAAMAGRWETVVEVMSEVIEAFPAERRDVSLGKKRWPPFDYLPYYYLGLAEFEKAGGCDGWSCAWDRSLEDGMGTWPSRKRRKIHEWQILEQRQRQCAGGG